LGGISDRHQEIDRRRKRRAKFKKFSAKVKKASASEKEVIVHKLRRMTPGCEVVIANLGLAKSDR
jgi:hypothetical protein